MTKPKLILFLRFLLQLLRLLCAQCLTNNGFKPKMLEFYCREILQVGLVSYEALLTIVVRASFKLAL